MHRHPGILSAAPGCRSTTDKSARTPTTPPRRADRAGEAREKHSLWDRGAFPPRQWRTQVSALILTEKLPSTTRNLTLYVLRLAAGEIQDGNCRADKCLPMEFVS